MDKILEGKRSVSGTITVPGDKSMSHRAVILGSLAQGTSRLHGLSTCCDVETTINAMKALGVSVDLDGTTASIEGLGIEGFEQKTRRGRVSIHCANSGTTARLLIGLLCGAGIRTRLTGDGSLMQRPMGRVVEPLSRFGAEVVSHDGFLPVKTGSRKPRPFEYLVPVPSAQVKSAMMLAALFIHGRVSITESIETRDHTERMLRLMGGDITLKNLQQGRTIIMRGRKRLVPLDIKIPGDTSSAVFFIASALVSASPHLIIRNVLLNQNRAHILEVFRRMGGRIDVEIIEEVPESFGNIRVQRSKLKGTVVDRWEVPFIIDEIPALAACAFFAQGDTVVRGASELRVKESDRIKGIVHMVKRFGGSIEELDDGFIIHGSNRPTQGIIESFHDHRLAMAASIIALNARGKSVVKDAECIDISFPGFFQELEDCTIL